MDVIIMPFVINNTFKKMTCFVFCCFVFVRTLYKVISPLTNIKLIQLKAQHGYYVVLLLLAR